MLCLPQQPQLRALTRSKSLCREQSQSRQASQRCRSFPYDRADYRAYSPPHPPLNIVEEAGDYNKDSSKFAVQIMAKGAFHMKEPLLSNESYHYKSDYHKQRHQKAGSEDSNPGDSPLLCTSPLVDTDYDQPNNVPRIVDADDLNLRESLLPNNTPNSSTDHDEAGNLERVAVLDPSGSNPSGFLALEIISGDGHNDFDLPRPRPRASSVKVFMLIGLSIEMLSAGFDQTSSPSKPRNALISLLLAAMAVLTCTWELLDNVIKDRDAYPNSMVFCTLPDFLGFGLAFIQFASSAVQYYFSSQHKSNPVKLSLVSLFCLFCLVVLKWKH